MAMRPSAGNIVQPAGENVGSRESRVLHRVDQTERELWSILAVANAAAGGDFIDYPLLLSGEHIIPWGEDATDRRVAAGEFVAFDVGMMGPTGYKVDVSRTFLCPPSMPTSKQRKLYRVAHEQLTHNAALIRPGATATP
jgi:Xaa-Pro dipeptidase